MTSPPLSPGCFPRSRDFSISADQPTVRETSKDFGGLPVKVPETGNTMIIGLEIVAVVVLLLAILGFVGFTGDLGWRSPRQRDGGAD